MILEISARVCGDSCATLRLEMCMSQEHGSPLIMALRDLGQNSRSGSMTISRIVSSFQKARSSCFQAPDCQWLSMRPSALLPSALALSHLGLASLTGVLTFDVMSAIKCVMRE